MSLFLTSLTFVGEANSIMASAGKVGTLLGSLISAIIGCGMLFLGLRSKKSEEQ
jgi:Na+/H+ antiporter NhaA